MSDDEKAFSVWESRYGQLAEEHARVREEAAAMKLRLGGRIIELEKALRKQQNRAGFMRNCADCNLSTCAHASLGHQIDDIDAVLGTPPPTAASQASAPGQPSAATPTVVTEVVEGKAHTRDCDRANATMVVGCKCPKPTQPPEADEVEPSFEPAPTESMATLRAKLAAQDTQIQRCRGAVEPFRDASGDWVDWVEWIAAQLAAERTAREKLAAEVRTANWTLRGALVWEVLGDELGQLPRAVEGILDELAVTKQQAETQARVSRENAERAIREAQRAEKAEERVEELEATVAECGAAPECVRWRNAAEKAERECTIASTHANQLQTENERARAERDAAIRERDHARGEIAEMMHPEFGEYGRLQVERDAAIRERNDLKARLQICRDLKEDGVALVVAERDAAQKRADEAFTDVAQLRHKLSKVLNPDERNAYELKVQQAEAAAEELRTALERLVHNKGDSDVVRKLYEAESLLSKHPAPKRPREEAAAELTETLDEITDSLSKHPAKGEKP